MGVGPTLETALPPLVAVLLAVALPFLTARGLAWAYLAHLPASGQDRAVRLVPFRRAAFVVGLSQLQLAWFLGSRALGPSLVDSRTSPASLGFGALVVIIAFMAGGIARRVADPPGERSTVLGVIALRARMVAFLSGPIGAGIAAAHLPLVVAATGAPVVQWGWVAIAFGLCALGAAFGGLFVTLVTTALVPATDDVKRAAREAAAAEGVSLWGILRLPTRGARFANAAALPWARTVIVSDGAKALLEPAELRSVLAHEAAHLSEGWAPMGARLGLTAGVVFAVMCLPELLATLPAVSAVTVSIAAVLVLLAAVVSVLRMARRMERRADARAAEHFGSAPLAAALRRLHEYAQVPMTMRPGTHPDLHARLVALGEEPAGPRPAPAPRRRGWLLGGAIGVGMLGVAAALQWATAIVPTAIPSTPTSTALWRLRVDPWDGDALLVLAWRAREAGRLDEARALLERSARMGPDEQSYYCLWAEVQAAAGDCAGARAAFESALEAQAERLFESEAPGRVELGDYALPPTFVRDCDLTVGEALGQPGDGTVTIDYTRPTR